MTRRNFEIVVGSKIDAIDWNSAIERISKWAAKGESRVVCICNAHSLVAATADADLSQAINSADMATPDGAPVAWMLRCLGHKGQSRINGPDLMWKYCAHAQESGQSIFLYGSDEVTLASLQIKLLSQYPMLKIVGTYSPPFRDLTEDERGAAIRMINNSGAQTVWVGLGCPKQEKWMYSNRELVRAVMVGVGAAFDYHAGTLRRAPKWMQDRGLEWLYRLLKEPRRLWRRYLTTNSIYILLASRQLLNVALRNK